MTNLLDLLRKNTEIRNETYLGCNFTPYSWEFRFNLNNILSSHKRYIYLKPGKGPIFTGLDRHFFQHRAAIPVCPTMSSLRHRNHFQAHQERVVTCGRHFFKGSTPVLAHTLHRRKHDYFVPDAHLQFAAEPALPITDEGIRILFELPIDISLIFMRLLLCVSML